MSTYSVHTKGASDSSPVLVREGFSLPAFLLGPISFMLRRAWLGVLVWAAGMASLAMLGVTTNTAPGALATAALVFMFLMAMEAPQFQRRSLARRGYILADVVEAANRNEAEMRFFARGVSAESRNVPGEPAKVRPTAQRNESVGLFLSGA